MTLTEGPRVDYSNPNQHPAGFRSGPTDVAPRSIPDSTVFVPTQPRERKRWFRPLSSDPEQAREIKTSTELIKGVMTHVGHRFERPVAPDDLSKITYTQALLEAIAYQQAGNDTDQSSSVTRVLVRTAIHDNKGVVTGRPDPESRGGRNKAIQDAGGTKVAGYALDIQSQVTKPDESLMDKDVIDRLSPFYGEESPQLAYTARKLVESLAAKKAEIAAQSEKWTPPEQLVVIHEAAKVQKRFAKKTGVDLSALEDYKLPKDKVNQAKRRKYGSMALNVFFEGVAYSAGLLTKDWSLFDFQNKAASVAVSIGTYLPLLTALVAHSHETVKLIREKGVSPVYFAKWLYERSLLKQAATNEAKKEGALFKMKEKVKKAKNKVIEVVPFLQKKHERNADKEKMKKEELAAHVGYGTQNLPPEGVFLATAFATGSVTFWAVSNLVSTAIIGGKIVGSKIYRLGFKAGLKETGREWFVNPAKKIAHLVRKEKAPVVQVVPQPEQTSIN